MVDLREMDEEREVRQYHFLLTMRGIQLVQPSTGACMYMYIQYSWLSEAEVGLSQTDGWDGMEAGSRALGGVDWDPGELGRTNGV